jgi:pimeloyl-ACP methyl ester carboxylesterase
VGAPTAFQVEVHGHGPPLVLIPGFASSGRVWDGVVAHEQDRYECHVLTLAGFAGVPAADEEAVLPAVREQLSQYLRAHKLSNAVVMGHSMGGVIALDLAAHHPDQVGRLVIVDSLPFLPAAMQPGATAQDMRAQAGAFRNLLQNQPLDQRRAYEERVLPTLITDPAKVEVALEWVMKSDAQTLAEAMFELMTTDLRPELSKIQAPTLVIATWHGMQGETREDVAQTFQAQYGSLAGVRIELADRARHFVMWDDPAWLHAQLDAFLPASVPAGMASR